MTTIILRCWFASSKQWIIARLSVLSFYLTIKRFYVYKSESSRRTCLCSWIIHRNALFSLRSFFNAFYFCERSPESENCDVNLTNKRKLSFVISFKYKNCNLFYRHPTRCPWHWNETCFILYHEEKQIIQFSVILYFNTTVNDFLRLLKNAVREGLSRGREGEHEIYLFVKQPPPL